MKTAVFITDGITQVVLTPETDLDRAVVDMVQSKMWSHDNPQEVQATLMRGSFYEAAGGWIRQSGHSENSLIIRVNAPFREVVKP